jgi:chitinase
LILGIATYGRSFTLKTASDNDYGALTSRAGKAGRYTREGGFLSYYEVCNILLLFYFHTIVSYKVEYYKMSN